MEGATPGKSLGLDDSNGPVSHLWLCLRAWNTEVKAL